jgi:hypothetical protein
MTFKITNHGQTPAHNVSHGSAIAVFPHPLPAGFQFPATVPAPSRFVLHPNAQFDAGAEAPNAFTVGQIQAAVTPNAGRRIYLYGTVTYTDVFDERRETTFCVSVVPTQSLAAMSQGQPQANLRIDFDVPEQHNEAT